MNYVKGADILEVVELLRTFNECAVKDRADYVNQPIGDIQRFCPWCHTKKCWLEFTGQIIFGLGTNNVLKSTQAFFRYQNMADMYTKLTETVNKLSPNVGRIG